MHFLLNSEKFISRPAVIVATAATACGFWIILIRLYITVIATIGNIHVCISCVVLVGTVIWIYYAVTVAAVGVRIMIARTSAVHVADTVMVAGIYAIWVILFPRTYQILEIVN